MRKVTLLLLTMLFCGSLRVPAQEVRRSLADALIALNERQAEWTIHFIYNDLDSFFVTAEGPDSLDVVEAVRRLVGIFPVRVTNEGRHLFVESLANHSEDELPAELNGQSLMPELTVYGHRPLVQVVDGRFVYDAEALANESGAANAYELLQCVPGIECANGRQLTLAGNESPSFVINGQRTVLGGEALADYLISLPAEQVQNIEVTPAAPVEWQTEGAAINLVLNRFGTKSTNGQTGVEANWQGALGGEVRAAIIADRPRWSTFGHIVVGSSHQRRREDISVCPFPDSKDVSEKALSEDTVSEVSLYVTSAHRLPNNSTLEISDAAAFTPGLYNTTGQGTSVLDSHSHDRSRFMQNDFQLAYNSTSLNAGIEAYVAGNERRQHIFFDFSQLYNDTLCVFQRSQQVARTRVWANFSRNLPLQQTLRFGGSYVFTAITNRPETVTKTYEEDEVPLYAPLLPASPAANHVAEHTANLFLALHGKIRQLSYDVALTYEHYVLDAHASPSLLPSLALTWKPRPKHSFVASFQSRRIYPSYWSRQNYISYTSNYVQHRGNPDLEPSTFHRAQLTYTLLDRYLLQLQYERSHRPLVNQPYQSALDNQLIYQEGNLDHSQRFMAVVTIPLRINRFMANLSVHGRYESYAASNWHGVAYDNSAWSFAATVTAAMTLLRRPRIDLYASALYSSRTVEGAYTRSPVATLNLRLQWQSVCRRFIASFSANDIFESQTPDQSLCLPYIPSANPHAYSINIRNNFYRRSFMLSIAYRFKADYKERASKPLDDSRIGVK